MNGACSMYGGEILTGILVGTSDRKKPLGRSRHRREDNVAVDLKEMGNDLTVCRDKWQAVLNMIMNLWLCSVQIFQTN